MYVQCMYVCAVHVYTHSHNIGCLLSRIFTVLARHAAELERMAENLEATYDKMSNLLAEEKAAGRLSETMKCLASDYNSLLPCPTQQHCMNLTMHSEGLRCRLRSRMHPCSTKAA